jgi:energy-coupling factor transporter ATP-binding protein EcfA2
MLSTLAIEGYRSLRRLILPLEQLNVVVGANGTGKSSLYRAIRLLAEAARNAAVAALAREGGLPSTLWAGPEVIGRAVREGVHPVQGTVRSNPSACDWASRPAVSATRSTWGYRSRPTARSSSAQRSSAFPPGAESCCAPSRFSPSGGTACSGRELPTAPGTKCHTRSQRSTACSACTPTSSAFPS